CAADDSYRRFSIFIARGPARPPGDIAYNFAPRRVDAPAMLRARSIRPGHTRAPLHSEPRRPARGLHRPRAGHPHAAPEAPSLARGGSRAAMVRPGHVFPGEGIADHLDSGG